MRAALTQNSSSFFLQLVAKRYHPKRPLCKKICHPCGWCVRSAITAVECAARKKLCRAGARAQSRGLSQHPRCGCESL